MGNFFPLLVSAPFAVLSVMSYRPETGFIGKTMYFGIAFVVVAWLFTNFFGYWQNGMMRRELAQRLDRERPGGEKTRRFIGYARPRYKGVLDAHEDVGYLIFHSDKLEIFGDHQKIEILPSTITELRFRGNIHTWVGLGRWISIEGLLEGTPIRLMVEPREKATMMGNLLYSSALKREIEAWWRERRILKTSETPSGEPESVSN
jgi:hypothetical protein